MCRACKVRSSLSLNMGTRGAELRYSFQERVPTPLCKSAAPLSALPKTVCCGPMAAAAEGEWLCSDVGVREGVLFLSEESSMDAVTWAETMPE